MEKIKKLSYIEYQGYVDEDGDLIYAKSAKDKINEFLQQHKDSYIDIKLSAELNRSAAQNRLQHLIYPAIGQALILSGNTNPLLLSLEYIKQRVVKPMFLKMYEGTPDEYIRSTADLTVFESWVYTNQILNYLLSIGGVLSEKALKQYHDIITRYKLENAIDETLARNEK